MNQPLSVDDLESMNRIASELMWGNDDQILLDIIDELGFDFNYTELDSDRYS